MQKRRKKQNDMIEVLVAMMQEKYGTLLMLLQLQGNVGTVKGVNTSKDMGHISGTANVFESNLICGSNNTLT